METTNVGCEIGTNNAVAKNSKKKVKIADLSKHRYFREPWALTFAGGADFEDRRPKVTGVVPEFHGVNRVAITREVRALVRYIRYVGGLESFVTQQASRASGMGKVPADVDPVEFVRFRLRYLLYLAHMTGAGTAKRRLKQITGHSGRYTMPTLRRLPANVIPLRTTTKALKFETLDHYLARGGSIKVYSAPLVFIDKNGWAFGRARLIREIVRGVVGVAV